MLRTGRLLREDFLQQSSFDETDAYCPLDKQHAILSVIKAAHEAMTAAVSAGVPAADVTGARILGEIARMRGWPPAGSGARADELTRRIEATLHLEDTLNPEDGPGPGGDAR